MSCVNNQVSDIQKSANYSLDDYQITIKSEIKFNLVGDLNIYSFSKFATGDYSVQSKMSETISNEKKLVDLLTIDISEQIIEALANYSNDS